MHKEEEDCQITEDLCPVEALNPTERRAVVQSLRAEVRQILFGLDVDRSRTERVLSLLEAPMPSKLSERARCEIAELRHDLRLLTDVEPLFVCEPQASPTAGLEVACSMRSRRLRLGLALLRLVASLAKGCGELEEDADFEDLLSRIAEMRESLSPTLADEAIRLRYTIYEQPRILQRAEDASKAAERWVASVENLPSVVPNRVPVELILAPQTVFNQISAWLGHPDTRRQAIAQSALLCRLYAPALPVLHTWTLHDDGWIDRLDLGDGRTILGAASSPQRAVSVAKALADAAVALHRRAGWPIVSAIELLVPCEGEAERARVNQWLRAALPKRLVGYESLRCALTTSLLVPRGVTRHESYDLDSTAGLQRTRIEKIHPETARRFELDRYDEVEIELISCEEEPYCFEMRSSEVPDDRRFFVAGEVLSGTLEGSDPAAAISAEFRRVFLEATMALRRSLCLRDPDRRLAGHEIRLLLSHLEPLSKESIGELIRPLLPATHYLALKRISIRTSIIDPQRPAAPENIIQEFATGTPWETAR